jgi:hypothetical protein
LDKHSIIVVIDVENDSDQKIAKGLLSSSSLEYADASANAVAAPTIPKIIRYRYGCALQSYIGMLAGMPQQAGLNPAVRVLDYGVLFVAFTYTATTNIAAAAAREFRNDATAATGTSTTMMTTIDDADVRRSTPHRPRMTRMLMTALRLASGVSLPSPSSGSACAS